MKEAGKGMCPTRNPRSGVQAKGIEGAKEEEVFQGEECF